MAGMTADWRQAACAFSVHYVILSKSRETDRQLIPFYRRWGQVAMENGRWTVLKVAEPERR